MSSRPAGRKSIRAAIERQFRRTVRTVPLICAVLLVGSAVSTAPALAGPGYPDGTGEFVPNSLIQYAVTGLTSPLSFWGGDCHTTVGNTFKNAYMSSQNWIRFAFKGNYQLGRPIAPVTAGTKGMYMRLYQLFDGGTWGRSSLTQTRGSFMWWPTITGICWTVPKLVTGAMFKYWDRRGNVQALGGPTTNQYFDHGWVVQGFEHGALTFASNDINNVWYAPAGGGWQPY